MGAVDPSPCSLAEAILENNVIKGAVNAVFAMPDLERL